ncbi:UDP-N-acetylmuramoyl-L-alanyl-D-glutamate synthetase [Fervidicella metallireducens AeB]|uniref:UDP-N-acetylmuramoylalanine--D-glutamate ligase n=1 Tax=Fervidicella metallireducens AeB TaxID=1403537 RepID=A0A017RRR4_9CLOT|nr:UDP-N-acetylmuramoyl-L-alanine--D-glutamate ligase [Fervidicella metallireducens]EYE87342.1 UDP-N-acetylmuramoyl-L-alanyl-D-glutamate synthetase [Fervidicella metallireducens AeB]
MKKNFYEFKQFIKGKKVAVVGLGVSNTPLIKMLVGLGASVVACDKRETLGDLERELLEIGVALRLGVDHLKGVEGCEVIFRAPSLMPNNEYLEKEKEKGAYITTEMKEFLKYCPCKIYGVTGSDGKTTTTTLIHEILKQEGYKVFLGGNIGKPLFPIIEEIDEDDYVVVELSSFQLMECEYSTDVAVITNLSPNHLDIHKDMNEYVNAKKNIFAHQDSNGIVVLNRDNDITYSMKNDVRNELRMFSTNDKGAFAYLEDDKLVVNGEIVCKKDEVKLLGMHNIENLLTAFAAVYGSTSIESMRKVATSFTGVEHRIEFVREINGVRFYNDSIASSPTRTIANLKSFNQKIVLIAGGYDKKIPFDELAKEGIERIKVLILMGLTKEKIRNAFLKEAEERNIKLPIIEVDSLEDAVNKAYLASEKGDIVALSPACASFDMFKDFAERGRKFKEIVMNLK